VKIAAAISGALLAGLAFAAYGCSASAPATDETPADQDASTASDTGGGSSSGNVNPGGDAGTNTGHDAAACGQQCATDQDCQNWCAPVNNGVNCCDSTHVCFQWSGNACPAQTQDSGTTPPY
jgi:hypothetical protein